MDWFLLAASALAALWMAVHGFVGGRECAGPLGRDHNLPVVVRETMLLCWHLVTGYLGLMALFLLLGALGSADMALAGVVMAAVTAAIGVVTPPLRRISYGVLPQGWLFVPIALLGSWSLWGG